MINYEFYKTGQIWLFLYKIMILFNKLNPISHPLSQIGFGHKTIIQTLKCGDHMVIVW